MTSLKHTALPWQLNSIHKDSLFIMADDLAFDGRRSRPICEIVTGWEGDGGYIEDTENAANAAFIIKACNAHDMLIFLAHQVIALLDEGSEAHDALLENEHDAAAHQERTPSMDNVRANILKVAKAALEKGQTSERHS